MTDQNRLPDLILAAMGTVDALEEHELTQIGSDHAITMRALGVIGNLYYVVSRIERRDLSKRSLKRLAVLRKRLLTFQNNARKRKAACKIASLSKQYSQVVNSGKRLCRELAPGCADYYDLGFGAIE